MIVASCQLLDIQNDVEASLSRIVEFGMEAERVGADLVCYPECFLQGYIVDEVKTREIAIDLSSEAFASLLRRVSAIKPMLVVGLVELSGEHLFNAAVVVKRGEVLGVYRKSRLLPREQLVFMPGDDFPVFKTNGMTFGINICYDLNFPECARAVADAGASLIVCPCNNMLRYQNAERWKEKHNPIRARRAVETNMWLLSSDVTGEREGRISYGPTALIDPEGSVVLQVPLGQEGMIVREIGL